MHDEKFLEGYETLRKSFATKLKDKYEELIIAKNNFKELYSIVHKIAGSSGMFGFTKISKTASNLEENLSQCKHLLEDLKLEMEKELL